MHRVFFLIVISIAFCPGRGLQRGSGGVIPAGVEVGNAQAPDRPVNLAVLDFGDSSFGRLASDQLSTNLKSEAELITIDRGQSRVAARGANYSGSLNLPLREARDLGAAIGCDYYVLGDAQTLRRSPSTGPIYFESYASIFLVSSRTGRLVRWERPVFRAATFAAAEKLLLTELSSNDARHRYVISIRREQENERKEREMAIDTKTPILEEAPDDDRIADAQGLRLPRPYRRLHPAYPESAARAEAEATVDVLVDLNAAGELTRVEVARWAGFGLDEATVETVRQLHFFPAMRNGTPIPIRVLLRYNFRKPPK